MLSNHPSILGSGAAGVTTPAAASAALDLISSTQGEILYRNATEWVGLDPGTSGQLLSTQGAAANPIWVTATGGAGDVNGPASATDNAIVRFDGTGGKTVQNSAVTIADTTGAIVGATSLTSQAATDLTLAGGSSGASLVLQTGVTGSATLTAAGTNRGISLIASGTGQIVGASNSGAGAFRSANIALSNYWDFGRDSASTGDFVFSNTGTPVARFTNAGALSIATTTASTSTTTGSLINAGGFGNAGAGYFGGGIYHTVGGNPYLQMDGSTLAGNMAMWFRQASPTSNNYGLIGSASTTYLNVATGGTVGLRIGNGDALTITVAAGALLGYATRINDTTSAVSSITGALRVGDGSTAATNVGIGGGNINAGGTLTVAGTVIHTLSATPASASAAGTVGTMSWDTNYIYICTATNTWKRVAIATW